MLSCFPLWWCGGGRRGGGREEEGGVNTERYTGHKMVWAQMVLKTVRQPDLDDFFFFPDGAELFGGLCKDLRGKISK